MNGCIAFDFAPSEFAKVKKSLKALIFQPENQKVENDDSEGVGGKSHIL